MRMPYQHFVCGNDINLWSKFNSCKRKSFCDRCSSTISARNEMGLSYFVRWNCLILLGDGGFFLLGNLRRTTPFTFTHLFVMVLPTGRWWTQIIRYLKSRNEFNWRKAEAFSRVVFHSKRQSAIIIYFRWIFLANNFWCILHNKYLILVMKWKLSHSVDRNIHNKL